MTPKVENLTSVLYGMRTVVRVETGSQFVKKLKRTEENRLVAVFLGFDCSSRFYSVYTAVIFADCIF